MNNTFYRTENGMIPAIPEPYYGILKKCDCGKKFLTKKSYQIHYITKHIYEM